MAGEWWRRLPAAQRAEYERSVAKTRVSLGSGPDLRDAVLEIARHLENDDRGATERASAHLVELLCKRLGLPRVRVSVSGVRPRDRSGELHGLYESDGGRTRELITVWMRTAQRRDVVAAKTFLRTLLHEVCHHLDFFGLDLPSSFHTPGFYRRESSLFRAVTRGTHLAVVRRGGPGARTAPPAARPSRAEREASEVREVQAEVDRAARRLGIAPRRRGPSGDEEPISGIDLLAAVAATISARKRRDEDGPGGEGR
ncbi:hypothetical protein KGQ64_08810 [bacterium]|nr:hypothetical protein [bacterium]